MSLQYRLKAAGLLLLAFPVGLPAYDLVPVPARIAPGQGALRIDETFRIALTGYREPRLQSAAERLAARLSYKTGIPMPAPVGLEEKATLVIECRHGSAPVQRLGEDESYRLAVAPDQARLTAETPLGVLRGLETFQQLVQLTAEGYQAPAVEIQDTPRFPWRGLMLDVARHWMPMETVKRTLDGMAAVKLNVLHWHLSDNQGFRIESKRFPRLHEMGSDGRYFTQAQAREVIAYARERGIRVIPEFDMPGHTTAWFVGRPDLASAPGPYQIERAWGIFDPSMDPTREEVYQFLDGFVGEMAALFPDEYFHIGGDEVNGKQWDASPRIQQFMREHGFKSNEELQAHFTRRVQQIVSRHGKKMIGWDEVLGPDLPRDVVVHSWRGPESLAKAARDGFEGILSAGYYLDLMRPASEHYMADPLGGEAANLTEEQKRRILGGEACMWTEYVTPQNLDQRLWPRLAAVAERLWSPVQVRDIGDMYRRLALLSRDLEWAGLQHRSGDLLMLERLAGRHPVAPLEVLAAIVEPVKNYTRGTLGKYTSFTPLNRLVDAALPESAIAREFGSLTDRARQREWLVLWRDNDARLQPAIRDSALLAEVAPLSRTVSQLAAAGLEALDFLEAGRHAPTDWTERQQALLHKAAEPQAEMLISILPPVQKLIESAR